MRRIFVVVMLLPGTLFSQKIKRVVRGWERAVINIETESAKYYEHEQDSIFKAMLKGREGTQQLVDSAASVMNATSISTGTAIYIKFNGRKYLLTAKHVIFDSAAIKEKIYQTATGKYKWEKLEGIAGRISIRTPFQYYLKTGKLNNYAVITNNLYEGRRPYLFISDSTGDGIGIISLQANKYFKMLDTTLIRNGYQAIELRDIITEEKIKILDKVYCIGYPEGISIVGRFGFPQPTLISQQIETVNSFVVEGYVSMFEEGIQHYFVDISISPGNSGSPIIKNGKLIGIVSGLNKTKIYVGGNQLNDNIFGLGHFANIIGVEKLYNELKAYQQTEQIE